MTRYAPLAFAAALALAIPAARAADDPLTATTAAARIDGTEGALAQTILAPSRDFSRLQLTTSKDQLAETDAVLDLARSLLTPPENPDDLNDQAPR